MLHVSLTFRTSSLVAATQQISSAPREGRYNVPHRKPYGTREWLVGSSAFDDLEKWQRLFATVILELLFAQ